MIRRMLRAVAALATFVALWGGARVPVQAGEGEAHCRDVTVPVALAEGQPARYQVWGRLCLPGGHRTATVEVLIHGLNYSHLYWDFPFEPDRYSYVRWADRAG